MVKRKAVFLDRDGTINIDAGYVHKIADFKFIKGAVQAIKRLRDNGFIIVVVTNQSGVGRGFYTEKDVLALHDYINRELHRQGTGIDRFYFCPHHPEAAIEKYKQDCNCRKPNPGMIRQAVDELDIDPGSSFMIGDQLRDITAGKRAGIKSILIQARDGIDENENLSQCEQPPDIVVKAIHQAVEFIFDNA